MKKLYAILLMAAVVLFSGCASVPMASKEADMAAKQFKPTEGKSNIYIYRNESFGAAAKMTVVVDGKLAGSTAAKTYMVESVNPGQHTIISKSEDDSTLNLTTEANKNYFVWQEVKMGMWSARSQLHFVNEEQGMEGVNECELIK